MTTCEFRVLARSRRVDCAASSFGPSAKERLTLRERDRDQHFFVAAKGLARIHIRLARDSSSSSSQAAKHGNDTTKQSNKLTSMLYRRFKLLSFSTFTPSHSSLQDITFNLQEITLGENIGLAVNFPIGHRPSADPIRIDEGESASPTLTLPRLDPRFDRLAFRRAQPELSHASHCPAANTSIVV